MRIRFANWQPDLQGLTNQGLQDVKNVYPTGGGYAPVHDLTAISTTGLIAKCQGAFAAQDDTGTTNTFAGDASKLYKLTGAAFGDVSKVGGYSVSATESWEFAQFGARVIATEISDDPQYYDLGSSSIFADLAGSPPRARHIAVIRDFVVLGNTENSPNEVFWSGFNNSAQWTPGTNQCDSQTLQGGGWVQRIVGGEVGYIFQERGITRMSYIGGDLIFQFDLIEQARGLVTPGALVTVGAVSYYRGQDGFYSFDPVAGSEPIGTLKVDRWFNDNLQSGTTSLITAAADPVNKLVVFSFVSTAATDAANPDTILIYNWQIKEWSYAKITHELIFPALSEGYTLETLSAAYPDLETVPVSLDSREWSGGLAYFGGFTTGHQLGSFTGDTLAGLMETADFEGVQGKRSLVSEIGAACDTSAATVIVRSRERFANSVTDTSSAVMESNGKFGVLSEGAVHRVQVSIPAGTDWTFATGVDVLARDAGEL